MADCAKALSDALDGTHSKEARLASLSSLQQKIDAQERLEDILSVVNAKWRKLTDRFLQENDAELLKGLSDFLWTTGKTAVVYGRFSVPGIDQFIYLSWCCAQLGHLSSVGRHIVFVLEGLVSCLEALEGSAFKSIAPGLLGRCHQLLNRPDTPISIFGRILDLISILCKAPSVMRDQFQPTIDLILGWAVDPEAPAEARIKVRHLFLKLRLYWETNIESGWNLILSMAKELCNMLDDELSQSGASGFVNLLSCLVVIFESCSPFLPAHMFSQIPAQVNNMVKAIILYPVLNTGQHLTLLEFADYMGEQLRILLAVLMGNNVLTGIQNAFFFLNKSIMDAQGLSSEVIMGILHLHFAFLDELSHQLEMLEGPVHEAYGVNSTFHNLRSSSSETVTKELTDLYKRLLSISAAPIQQHFFRLFLRELSWTPNKETREALSEDQDLSAVSARQSNEKQDFENAILKMKKQVFALNLFFAWYDGKEENESLGLTLWENVTLLFKNETFHLLHPIISLQSVKLLRKISASWTNHLSESFSFLMEILPKQDLKECKESLMVILQWIIEIIEQFQTQDCVSPESLELILLSWMSDHDVSTRVLILKIFQKMVETRFPLKHKEKIITQIYLSLSDLDSDVASEALQVLKSCGKFALFQFSNPQLLSFQDLQFGERPSAHKPLTQHQISFILGKLASGWPKNSLEEPEDTNWIIQILESMNLKESCQTLNIAGRRMMHELARELTMSSFSQFKSGPSHVLKYLSEQFTNLQQAIQEQSSVNHFHLGLLLDFAFVLEREVTLAFEGYYLQNSIQNFYATNFPNFEKLFGSLYFKLLMVSHKTGFSYHAAHYGYAFLKLQCKELQKDGFVILAEVVPAPVKQSIIKLRPKLSQELTIKQTNFIRQFFKGLTYTALSLHHLSDHDGILGLKSEIMPVVENLVKPVEGVISSVLLSWMDALALESNEKVETAIECYNQSFRDLCKMEESVIRALQVQDIKSVLLKIVQILKMFLLDRLSYCYGRIADWETFSGFKEAIQSKEFKSKLKSKFRTNAIEMLYDYGQIDQILEDAKGWTEPSFEILNLDDVTDAFSMLAIEKSISAHKTLGPQHQEMEVPWMMISDLRHLLFSQEIILASKMVQLVHLMQCMENIDFLRSLTELLETPDIALPLLFPDLASEESLEVHMDSGLLLNLIRLGSSGTMGSWFLTLFHTKLQTDQENFDHAARSLRFLSGKIEEFPEWMKHAINSEKSRLVLQNAKNEKDSSLMWSHYSNLLYQDLGNIKTSGSCTQTAAHQVMAIRLVRSFEELSLLKDSPKINEFLGEQEIANVANGAKNKYLSQLKNAGILKEPKKQNAVLRMQSSFICSALELMPSHSTSWKHFGQLLLSEKSNENQKPLKNAVFALCQALKLRSNSPPDMEVLLELFGLIRQRGEVLLDDEMVKELESMCGTIWRPLSTQLISLLGHSCDAVRKTMVTLLKKVAKAFPVCVLFPVLVQWRKQNQHQELQSLVQSFQDNNNGLIEDMTILLNELESLNSLISEEWLTFLSDLHMEAQVRLSVYQEEVKRIKSEDKGERKSGMYKEAYCTVMMPLVRMMKRRILEKKDSYHTEFEKEYWSGFERKAQQLLAQLECKEKLGDAHEVEKRWSLLKTLLSEVGEEAKKPLPVLEKISPKLSQLKDTMIPVPGVSSNSVTIAAFLPEVEIKSTKTRPKTLKILGSDGLCYSFLLKGKEDMNIDHRLLQFLEVSNHFIESKGRRKIRNYNVTPLGDKIGLIQWVDNTVSFYSMFTNWQDRQKRKIKTMNESSSDGHQKKIPMIVELHPKHQFKKYLSQAFADGEFPKGLPRSSWPNDLLYQVFAKLQSECPRDLLKKEICRVSSNASAFWKKTRHFVQSTAMSSVLCYLLGIGDRHLDNLLLDLKTAELIHIDFNLCFGNGEKLRVPEIVPFRMTQTMQEAVGVGGIHGPFRNIFMETLSGLRKHGKCLEIFLEAILEDPVMDWTSSKTKMSFKQGLDQILKLKLLLMRLDDKNGVHRMFQGYLNYQKKLTKASSGLIESVKNRSKLLKQKEQVAELVKEADGELSSLLQKEEIMIQNLQEQEKLHGSQLQSYQEMTETVNQILTHNQSWCYRHVCLLESLLNQSEELLIFSPELWNASEGSPNSNNIVLAKNHEQPSMLISLFQDNALETLIQQDILQACVVADEQRELLDSTREGLFAPMLDAIQQYTFVLKALFSEDYLCSSFHFRFLRSFQSVLNVIPAFARRALAQPPERDVENYYLACSSAFSQIEEKIRNEKNRSSDEFTAVQKSAASKIPPLQKALSSTWSADLFKDLLVELCSQQNQSIITNPTSVQRWVEKISGFSQIFRLFRSPKQAQELLCEAWDIGVDGSDTISTGFFWLDTIEQYVSRTAVLLQDFKNSPMIDLSCFSKTGLIARTQEIRNQFQSFHSQAQELCRKSWETSQKESDQTEQIRSLDLKKNQTITQLEEINQQIGTQDNLRGSGLLELAQYQKELSAEVQKIQDQSNAIDKTLLDLQKSSEEISQNFESLCEQFVWTLSGETKQTIRLQNDDDFMEVQLSSKEVGDLDFPVFHSLFQIFQQMELIESGLQELWNLDFLQEQDKKEFFKVPSKYQQFDCWIENISCTAFLSNCLLNIMTVETDAEEDLTTIIESHFLDLLHRRAHPVFSAGLEKLKSVLVLKEDKTPHDELPIEDWNQALEILTQCITAQGEYTYVALMHQSSKAWAENDHQDQSCRFQHLAAMEWTYQNQLKDSNQGYLKKYLMEHHFPAEREVPSRSGLLHIIKERLESLLQIECTGKEIEEYCSTALLDLQQYLALSFEECPDQQSCTGLINLLQVLVEERQNWREGAHQMILRMVHVAQTLLQFELSREALTWSPGEEPDGQAFTKFEEWYKKVCDLVEEKEKAEEIMQTQKTQRMNMTTRIEKTQSKKRDAAGEMDSTQKALGENWSLAMEAAHGVVAVAEVMVQSCPVLVKYLKDCLGTWLQSHALLTQGSKHLYEASKKAEEVTPLLEEVIRTQESLKDSLEKTVNAISTEMDARNSTENNSQASSTKLELENQHLALPEVAIRQVQKSFIAAEEAADEIKKLKDALDSLLASSWDLIHQNDPLDESTLSTNTPTTSGLELTEMGIMKISAEGLSQGAQDEKTVIDASGIELPITLQSDEEEVFHSSQSSIASMQEKAPEDANASMPHPSISTPLNQVQMEYTERTMRYFKERLFGRKRSNGDLSNSESTSVEAETDRLISEAIDENRLCKMYEGWMSWI